MSAFSDASQWEKQAFLDIVPFLKANGDAVIDTKTIKGTIAKPGECQLFGVSQLSEEIQSDIGDFIFKCSDSESHTIEVKAEESFAYGNLFLETWSNRKRRTPGWMCKLKCSRLFYFFCKERWLLSFDFKELRNWAFHQGRIYDFPEKCQKKREQLNDTWGHCVPVSILVAETSPKQFFFEGEYGNVSRKIP